MDFKKALPLLAKVVSWATPKRVLQLAAATCVLIGCLTVFEHRSAMVDRLFNDSELANPELKLLLPDEIKNHLADVVKRSPEIIMVQVVSANVRINQRELVYYVTDDPVVESSMRSYVQSRTSGKPIFTSDEKNNAQMVSVMNGEFGCYKYGDTLTTALMPKITNKASAVCRVSLPPYYGEFSGYLSFTLATYPDPQLQDDIRITATNMATEIYFKSIGKKQR